jgi:hypothetical protein
MIAILVLTLATAAPVACQPGYDPPPNPLALLPARDAAAFAIRQGVALVDVEVLKPASKYGNPLRLKVLRVWMGPKVKKIDVQDRCSGFAADYPGTRLCLLLKIRYELDGKPFWEVDEVLTGKGIASIDAYERAVDELLGSPRPASFTSAYIPPYVPPQPE